MEIGAMLDELREMALKDEKIRQELLDTRKDAHPLAAFCSKCRELGYEIYEMDLITAGEEFCATSFGIISWSPIICAAASVSLFTKSTDSL